MIAGTPFSPGKAFVDAAKTFLRQVASEDFGAAFRTLDKNEDGTRWSKQQWLRCLRNHVTGSVTAPDDLADSAKPVLRDLEPGSVYELRHAIPIDGKWSKATIVLRFTRKTDSQYYRVTLLGIENT